MGNDSSGKEVALSMQSLRVRLSYYSPILLRSFNGRAVLLHSTDGSSILSRSTKFYQSVADIGFSTAFGTLGCRFDSYHSDQFNALFVYRFRTLPFQGGEQGSIP